MSGERYVSYAAFVFSVILFAAATAATAQRPAGAGVPVASDARNAKAATAAAVKPAALAKLETIEDYLAAIEADPSFGVGYNNLANLYVKAGRIDEALAALEKAVLLTPDDPKIQLNLSVVLDHLGRTADSIAPALRAVELAPSNSDARAALCSRLLRLARYDEAVGCYESLRAMKLGDPMVEVGYGMALLGSDSDENALEVLEKAASDFPRFPAAFNALGAAHYDAERYDEAAAALKTAVELEPDRVMFRFNLGVTEMARRNRAGALSQYKFVKRADPALAARMFRYIFSDKVVFVGPEALATQPR